MEITGNDLAVSFECLYVFVGEKNQGKLLIA